MEVMIFLLFNHWVADFLCQTRNMADNKGKSLYWLTVHVLAYAGAFALGCLGIYFYSEVSFDQILIFWLINVVLHWFTDLVTSKLTSYFYKRGEIKPFFSTIGFDQFLHTAAMLISFQYFLT